MSGGDLEISATVGSTGGRGSKDMPVHAHEQERTSLLNITQHNWLYVYTVIKAGDLRQVLQFN